MSRTSLTNLMPQFSSQMSARILAPRRKSMCFSKPFCSPRGSPDLRLDLEQVEQGFLEEEDLGASQGELFLRRMNAVPSVLDDDVFKDGLADGLDLADVAVAILDVGKGVQHLLAGRQELGDFHGHPGRADDANAVEILGHAHGASPRTSSWTAAMVLKMRSASKPWSCSPVWIPGCSGTRRSRGPRTG